MKSLLYFGYHLLETINNYISSSMRLLWRKYRVAPALPSSVVFFSLITTNFQCLEHHWIVKIVLLVFPESIALVLTKINEQFRSMTQSPWENDHGVQSMWKNMSRYLENFSPSRVWNFTPKQWQDDDELVEFWKKQLLWLFHSDTIDDTMLGPGQDLQNSAWYLQHPQEEERKNKQTNIIASSW